MTANQVKHLEMIQDIVDRMNRNSFQIKAIVAVIIAGILTLYSRVPNVWILYMGIAPVILFWILDSFYLQTERKFLALYKDIVDNPTSANYKEFAMPIGNYRRVYYSLVSAMGYSINCVIYLIMIVLLLALGYVLSIPATT